MIDYQKFAPKNMSVKERRKLDVGDIFSNSATCLICNDTIRSKNRHDFQTCKCGKLSIDGGSWYPKRSFKKEHSWKDNIELYEIMGETIS